MNQEDRAAAPMFGGFTNTADFTPYTAAPETIPLTQGLTSTSAGGRPAFVPATPAKLGIPRSEWKIYNAWVVWTRHGRFNGKHAVNDWANPAQLNRLDWYSTHDWKVPYPRDKAILLPQQVPGHNLPAGYLGD